MQVVSSLITFYSVAAAQGGAGGFRSFCVMFDLVGVCHGGT